MTPKIRRIIRERFGVSNHVPVIDDPGESYEPFLVGKRGGHYTKGGTRIRHVNAYCKKGWSNIKYVRSSQVIYVGQYGVNNLEY